MDNSGESFMYECELGLGVLRRVFAFASEQLH